MMVAMSTVVPPDRLKAQAASTHVKELMSAVEGYIVAAIEVITANRDKTKFKLAD